MQRFVLSIIMVFLISAQAFALDAVTVDIKVTVNQQPGIGSFLPGDGYIISEGDILEIMVNAADPNNDVLQYRYLVNDVVKNTWSAEAMFSYTLTDSDIGLNRIKAEVTDGIETVQTQQVEIYVFRKSPDLPTEQ